MPIITTPYIARILGPTEIGIQAYTMSIANYFVLFAMLGINNHGNRTIASVRGNRQKLSETFYSIYYLQLIISISIFVAYCFYIYFFVYIYKSIFIIQAIYLISATLDINWFYFGIEQFKLTVIRNSVVKLLSVICIFIFVKKENDLYIYSLILAMGNLLSQILLWKFIHRYIDLTRISLKKIFINFKPCLILFIPVISVSIYKIMSKIMLGYMRNVTEVGFFENSEKIINIPMGIIVALGTVMLPKMSNIYSNGNELEGRVYIEKSIEFVMFISFGIMFGLIGVSRQLIPIFLDVKFIECIKIVSLLSVTIIFLSWGNVIRTQYLIPKRKDKIYIMSTIFGAIVNFSINIILIRRLGVIGAAIGNIFAEAVVAIYQSVMVRKELDVVLYLKKTLFYFIPGIIMLVVVLNIGNKSEISILTLVIQVLVGASIYITISFIYMLKTKNQMLLDIINRIKLKLKVK
jgi:O-antigen/teichoic acid export membrane protein